MLDGGVGSKNKHVKHPAEQWRKAINYSARWSLAEGRIPFDVVNISYWRIKSARQFARCPVHHTMNTICSCTAVCINYRMHKIQFPFFGRWIKFSSRFQSFMSEEGMKFIEIWFFLNFGKCLDGSCTFERRREGGKMCQCIIENSKQKSRKIKSPLLRYQIIQNGAISSRIN